MYFKITSQEPLTRDVVLKEMIGEIWVDLDEDKYLEELMKRKNLASTALENKVDIPHPLSPITDDNFLGLYICPSGIKWTDKMVNIVILINLNDNIKRSTVENFYRYLSEFLNDDKKIIAQLRLLPWKNFGKSFLQNKKFDHRKLSGGQIFLLLFLN